MASWVSFWSDWRFQSTPLLRATTPRPMPAPAARGFNPRRSCKRRREGPAVVNTSTVFQSTPLLRATTRSTAWPRQSRRVSIRAALASDDRNILYVTEMRAPRLDIKDICRNDEGPVCAPKPIKGGANLPAFPCRPPLRTACPLRAAHSTDYPPQTRPHSKKRRRITSLECQHR